ncbi:ureidoglycolate dehydrogenase [Staphylococcus carnosus]|uniref:Ureidoglycolate dehydrogenase n=1 Tax=Staphylococcus carnosus (strain TM300) TaxID=396513 RepID=B9DKI8_STACT|nr:ureidoglycolate dehydrogenase [Staphylococcus carnosus]QPT05026.1 ureidoglycolate dehydrogenase [Staphylococcus carnosus]UQA67751.1 ureidoglycolate dehydrogenase [Staphylococcus carnosus]UTB77426.1 ureidoglycolate dehydrogenase [Staphylococcus carnosus]UTB86970.1 ureidoglycolate dehydrogenase [Staphylococcus carnosus]UTB89320.1 ureidoglycolate dehydrogenase [Staphylococcus carnosus]
MSEENLVYIQHDELRQLFKDKLMHAGMPEKYADKVAELMIFADARGIHSHGAVRLQYYAERTAKGGFNLEPQIEFEQTGPSTAIYHADNTLGHYAAYHAMEEAIRMAEENGIAAVGVKEMGHSGAIGYYVKMAAEKGLVALSVCQSDPMVVPFGGSKPYFGTNPIAFGAPRENGAPIVFDMATTVQAWGKILDARSKNHSIPDTWAVDDKGEPTTDPYKVSALLPVAGPKGYGLMMMVDILSGSLLGLPFGQHVTSMYEDYSQYRRLGQFHLVINPSYFGDEKQFLEQMNQMVNELHDIEPAQGFDQVYYPGEIQEDVVKKYEKSGIPIPESIYDYMKSDKIY